MKKLLLVPFILLALDVQCQEVPSFEMPRTIVKFSPLYFFVNTFQLGIETFNADVSRSFNLDVGYRSSSYDYEDESGFDAELAYRRYVAPMRIHTRKSRQFYQGIYYCIFVRGETFQGKPYDYNIGRYSENAVRINSLAPGFTLGLQKTLWEIVFLDVSVGGGVKFSDGEGLNDPYYYESEITQPGYEGIFPRIGAKIGVRL